jgi:hypothetical protein
MSSAMARPISTQQDIPAVPPARKVVPVVAVGAVGLGTAILLGTLMLWFYYGTAVFFEMVASGIAACF